MPAAAAIFRQAFRCLSAFRFQPLSPCADAAFAAFCRADIFHGCHTPPIRPFSPPAADDSSSPPRWLSKLADTVFLPLARLPFIRFIRHFFAIAPLAVFCHFSPPGISDFRHFRLHYFRRHFSFSPELPGREPCASEAYAAPLRSRRLSLMLLRVFRSHASREAYASRQMA